MGKMPRIVVITISFRWLTKSWKRLTISSSGFSRHQTQVLLILTHQSSLLRRLNTWSMMLFSKLAFRARWDACLTSGSCPTREVGKTISSNRSQSIFGGWSMTTTISLGWQGWWNHAGCLVTRRRGAVCLRPLCGPLRSTLSSISLNLSTFTGGIGAFQEHQYKI